MKQVPFHVWDIKICKSGDLLPSVDGQVLARQPRGRYAELGKEAP